VKIAKTRNVKTPTRGTDGSAGIDFYIPDDCDIDLIIQPHDSVLIPSGIKANVPEGFALIAFNKSGIALKKRLSVGACVVDSDYHGEIHLHVFNRSARKSVLEPGQKLVQFLLMPVDHCSVEVLEEEALFLGDNTNRGTGGFGSTGDF